MTFWTPLPQCKIQTYIDAGVVDYVKSRYQKDQLVRTAIMPFDVPENFALVGNESQHYGRELARRLQNEIYASGEMGIVELFNRDRWPGKREEFFTGNYQALAMARDAGYDLVIVGYLEEPKNAEQLTLYTKTIDTANAVTVWSAQTVVTSKGREARDTMALVGLGQRRPELFDFPEKTDALVSCTARRMLGVEP